MKIRPYFFWLCLTLAAHAAEPLNGVVLVISDGTSQELLTASRLYFAGVDGKLDLESLPQTAIVRTCSRSDLVTDSAAGATAMARGIKADNTVLGMESARAKSGPPSILDVAREAGWSTGVISDDSVTGATPSAFVVECASRDSSLEIARKEIEQLGKRVDVLLGGGTGTVRDDQTQATGDALEEVKKNRQLLEKSGAAYFSVPDDFKAYAATGGDGRPVLGTFAKNEFSFYADGTRKFRLVDMVEGAVGLLEARKKPFFLMVEAGLPDKACHLNNAKRAITEVGELNATIAWLRKNLPQRTLLLITTDHNNGGFTINGQPAPRAAHGDALLQKSPVNGEMLFTWASGPGGDAKVNDGISPTDAHYAQPAVYARDSSMHSGGDVWLLGEGPGSEAVHGFLDNTDIFRIMSDAISAKP